MWVGVELEQLVAAVRGGQPQDPGGGRDFGGGGGVHGGGRQGDHVGRRQQVARQLVPAEVLVLRAEGGGGGGGSGQGGGASGQEGLAVITSKRKRRDKDVSVSGQPTGGRLEAAPRVGAGRCTAPVGYDVSRTYRINHGWGFRAPRAGQVLRVGTLCVLGNRSDPLGIVGPYDVPAASGPRGAAPSCGGGGDTGPQVEGRRAAQLAACDVNNGNKVVEIGQLRSSTQSLSLPNLK